MSKDTLGLIGIVIFVIVAVGAMVYCFYQALKGVRNL